MSDIDRERARKEAADALTSRPPGEGESRVQAALRRYLGTSLTSLRSRDRSKPPEDAPPPGQRRGTQPEDQDK